MLGSHARVVDSAEATALELGTLIASRNMGRSADDRGGTLELMVTDRPQSFADVAARFLGHPVPDVELVDL